MAYITHYCEWKYKNGTTCGASLTEHVYNYSITNYGTPLCFGHQGQLKARENGGYDGYRTPFKEDNE